MSLPGERGPKADVRWHFHGLRAVVIENRQLRILILPEAGGRIQQITHKPSDTELLWNHPRIRPARLPFGASYDDNWSGGWDELLPNNIPETINDEAYPDHGEVWAADWAFTPFEDAREAGAALKCQTRISDILLEKRIRLREDESALNVDYRLHNGSRLPLPILWNLHVPFAVSERHRLEFPPMQASLEPNYLGSLQGAPIDFTWPLIDAPEGRLDLSAVPAASAQRLHFVYGHGFTEGYCGVIEAAAGLRARVWFDPSIFRACWLFGAFGGWRNLHVALLEPSTGYPFEVARAVRNGTCRTLAPGEELRTSVRFEVTNVG